MLFKDEYPEEYGYFKSALETELRSSEPDVATRATLTSALAKLDEVCVFRKCPCGEPNCATFSFADYQRGGNYRESIPLFETSETVVIDVDKKGNIIGVERI